MATFIKNLLIWIIYSIIMAILILIANPTITIREHIGYSLILGFFAGLINAVAVREYKNE